MFRPTSRNLPHRQREISWVTLARPYQKTAVKSSLQKESFGVEASDFAVEPSRIWNGQYVERSTLVTGECTCK